MRKVIAFYLPQYHRFKENDEWWGEGFTEWVNTKKAKPLYKNHYQPKVPEGENYYNLLDRNAWDFQMSLASKYNIFGFCFYHYWFNGKLLMEKPLEIMLSCENRINYCFCWANEPWTRAWDGQTKEILMPQVYSGINDWERHFTYLKRFFLDEKYIKVDNKPLFIVYRSNNIPDFRDMIKYFEKKCIEIGFAGIKIIEEFNSFQNSMIDNQSEALYFEPMHTIGFCRSFLEKVFEKTSNRLFNILHNTNVKRFSYDKIWKDILNKNNKSHVYPGAFIDWDNTARRGKNSTIIYGGSPYKFKKYFQKLLMTNSKDFVFVNAWNEWAEGAYLEPDNKNGCKYLEMIKNVIEESDD